MENDGENKEKRGGGRRLQMKGVFESFEYPYKVFSSNHPEHFAHSKWG